MALAGASSLEPESRLISLALLSSAAILASWPFAAALALLSLGFLALEGVRPATALKESAFVLAFALFAGVARLWGQSSAAELGALARESAVYALKLLAAFLLGRLFYASTRPPELRDACTRLTRRIPIIRRFDTGLALSLVIGYLPLIFSEWRSSLEAARSRGMPKRPSLALQAAFLAAYIRRLMLNAVSLPEALIARGWTRDRGLSPLSLRKRDFCAVAVSLLAFVGASLRLV
jgi:energy-coupling factor transporter transmembrane protein EcfT